MEVEIFNDRKNDDGKYRSKIFIPKSAIVAFFDLNNGDTQVWLRGYFSQQVKMNYEEFKKLYNETKD